VSLTLVIGGTRSGKSAHAERLALAAGAEVSYVATADRGDASMAERIRAHVARRPSHWRTVEVLADDLAAALDPDRVSVIDGLGVWIGGVLHRGGGSVADEVDRVALAARDRDVIVVAEEAGQGLLPADELSRRWLDLLGEATQRLAAAAERVDYVVAGRAISLASASSAARPVLAVPDVVRHGLRHHGDRDVRPGDADHAVNVLESRPPGWLREALDQALDGDAGRYPDDTIAAATTAARHDRQPDEIVPCNGAAEALWLLGPALRPRLAACVHPAFTEAEAGLRAHGSPVVRVQRDPDAGFRLDPTAVPEAADLVVVGNPASPSGTLEPATALLALRRPGRTVVVDEAFMGMVPGEPGSLGGERLDDVIVIRSLTKLLSIPGLRAGYAIAPAELALALRAVRPPWSANVLALAALTAAARHPAEAAALAERSAAQGADLQRRLSALNGLRLWPSVTNFSLVEVPDGERVAAALRAQRIAVRPAASFPGLGPGHLRITARDPERNRAVAAALADALATAGAVV
jgi:histidinol-phosphate/aromatic aminotransferase/cobyric acid decarboxylase-like protein/adenosyl cobinamide kinase/adenosyl cobinamide phosphate guanylyltransferase